MRILIFEHICSGGLAGHPLDTRLMSKGGAMLRAITEDFHAAGQDVLVMLDARVPYRLPGRIVTVEPGNAQNALDAFDQCLKHVDAALAIAPEFLDLLPGWLQRIEQAGVKNLGSTSAAVRSTSDKHALALRLNTLGVKMPVGALGLQSAPAMLKQFSELVIKPNHGAGCIDTYVCRSEADLPNLPSRTDWLIQERIEGAPASVAFVVPANGQPIPLRAGAQTIKADLPTQSFKLDYSGGQLPLPPDLEQRAINLGLAALPHLPGLHGCIGMDLILGPTIAQDTLIEVNPRPTVAYTGLRRLAKFLIPNLILNRPTQILWRPGSIRYQSDGAYEIVPEL